MDIADRAQQDIDFMESVKRGPITKEAPETGFCLFCGEPVPKGHRWCDKVCRDLWEKEQHRDNPYSKCR